MICFPIDIARTIGDYVAVWTIVPWVQELESEIKSIFQPDMYGGRTYDEYKKTLLSQNPMAEDVLIGQDPDYLGLANNPADWAMDLIESAPAGAYESCYFVDNPNPRAIAIMNNDFDSIDPDEYYGSILGNPSAIELIKSRNLLEKVDLESKYMLYINPNELAFDLIKGCDQIKQHQNNVQALWCIAANPAHWAVQLLINKDVREFYGMLCRNSHPRVITFITKHTQDLKIGDWMMLSGNSGAMDILRMNPDKVTIYIWTNPAIFELTPRPGVLDILTELSW